MTNMTPESKYPAALEDIDTIITGKDGKDYVVDVIEGVKKWVPYLPEPDHVIVLEKILPDLAFAKAELDKNPQPNQYQKFLKETTDWLKKNEPNLSPAERRERVKTLWAAKKSSQKSSAC